ncbi:DUF5615 family PIN-like protein [Candidatus Pacearchaeota archaeon]|nr:DUF5615 family PIN-like protein [Candidatus Pacearchaeota archaeon]
MVRFLVDESSGKRISIFLKSKDFDVKFVGDEMHKADDLDILKSAENEKRVLITNDKDFGELIFRLKMPSSGVILLRLKKDNYKNREKYLEFLLNNYLNRLEDNFIVIDESSVRFREI